MGNWIKLQDHVQSVQEQRREAPTPLFGVTYTWKPIEDSAQYTASLIFIKIKFKIGDMQFLSDNNVSEILSVA